jgi:hypothetical protein
MKKLSGWQKAGLVAGVGCASIIVVVVIGVIVAVAWARSTVAELDDTTPARHERTVALAAPGAGAPEGAGTTSAARKEGEPLRLTIELAEGKFTIEPGPAGSQVQVEGTYAEGLYDLEEKHDTDQANRARTTIRFRSKAPIWARVLAGIGNDRQGQPEMTVHIPSGVPINLSLRIGMGESRIDLGGLTLTELGLDLSMGNHELDFREPVVEGLRRLRLNASMGNISIDNLGNARAQSIDTSGSMGNLTADLGGAWQPGADANLSFNHSMGELRLRVPSEVRLEANVTNSQGGQTENRSSGDGETTDPAAPVLRVRVSTSMGESRITRY